MSAITIQVADAVVASLNASGLPIQAERKWRAFGELDAAPGTYVTVLPSAADWENRDRSGGTVDVTILVGVQAKLDESGANPNPPEMQLDLAAELCEDIASWLRGKDMAGGRYLSVKQDPLWVPEHYELWNQFTGFVEATYRCVAP